MCVDPYYITRCVYTLWAHAPLLLFSSAFFLLCLCLYLYLCFCCLCLRFLFFLLVFCFVVFAYAALFTLLYLLFRYSTTFFHIDHAESSRLQFNLPRHFPDSDSDSDFDFDIDMSCLESSASLFPPSRFPRFDFLFFFFISAFFGGYPLIVAVFSTFFSRCSFCGLIVPVVPVPAAATREHP